MANKVRTTRSNGKSNLQQQVEHAQEVSKQVAKEIATEKTTPQVDVSAAQSKTLDGIKRIIGKVDAHFSVYAKQVNVSRNMTEAAPARMMQILEDDLCEPKDETEMVNGKPVITRVYQRDLSEFFPRPVKDANAEKGSNLPLRNFFKAPKPNAQGVPTPRQCDYFSESILETEVGKELAFIEKQCDYITADNGANYARAEQKYKDMDKKDVAALGRQAGKDLSNTRKALRQAVGLWFNIHDLNDEYSERAYFRYTHPEQLDKSRYAFLLVDSSKGLTGNYQTLTVQDMLRFNVRAAIIKAGPAGSIYQCLLEQLSKEGSEEQKLEALRFKTEKDVWIAIRRFNNWFDAGSQEGKDHFDDIRKQFTEKGSDVAVHEFGTFLANVRAIWTPALATRWQKMIETAIATADGKPTTEEGKAAIKAEAGVAA